MLENVRDCWIILKYLEGCTFWWLVEDVGISCMRYKLFACVRNCWNGLGMFGGSWRQCVYVHMCATAVDAACTILHYPELSCPAVCVNWRADPLGRNYSILLVVP